MKYADKSFWPARIVAIGATLLLVIAAQALIQRRPNDKALRVQHTSASITEAHQQQRLEAYARLPLRFEANAGQTDERVQFLARGAGYTVFLTAHEAVMALQRPGNREQTAAGREPASQKQTPGPEKTAARAVVRMRLLGANPNPTITGQDKLRSKSAYFTGNDPSQWRTNVPNYQTVRYEAVYAGIDLVYYGNQQALEYDFVVHPGVDAEAITLAFTGPAEGEGHAVMEIDEQGDLILHTEGGELRQPKPFVYQEVDGTRREIAGRYVLKEAGRVGFELGAYDAGQALVIDPVLIYSTYLGGSGDLDQGTDIVVDGSGDAYIMGTTNSTDFPTVGALQGTYGGGLRDVFVAKLNAAGSALVYSTYLGGSGDDTSSNLAVDGSGNAYLTGQTNSTDFPTASPLQGTLNGIGDAYIAKLNAAGSALVYSTYLGGSGDDIGTGIDVDGSGNAYVTGLTLSTDFPTANPLQGTFGGGFDDAFVAKLNAAGSALVYSTYLGGSSQDEGFGIAVDGAGSAYVTGLTESTDFPTATPLQGTFGGVRDAFMAKLNATGSTLVYATYLGGSGFDHGFGIAVDGAGSAYVTGRTRSTDFPTASPLQGTFGGGLFLGDTFVTKVNATGSALVYSTYLGGSGDDVSQGGIAVDGSGNAYVTGRTNSTDFPTASPLQGTFGGVEDAFVTAFNAAGSAFLYSTYLGGSGDEQGVDIAVDGSGNAYVTGRTNSTDFPTASPLQGTLNGVRNAFVAKIGVSNQPPDCSEAAIADQRADATCQASISDADVTGVTDPDDDPLTITVNPTILSLGPNTVTVTADDGNGGTCSIDITVNVIDHTPPEVTAELITVPGDDDDDDDGGGDRFKVQCSATDACDADPTITSILVTPDLDNPTVKFKQKNNKKLVFDLGRNRVTVRGPDPQAFWADVEATDGVAVYSGQVLSLSVGGDDDDGGSRVVYTFDSGGDLTSVTGSDPAVLRCAATDASGNVGTAEATALAPGGSDDDDDDGDDDDEDRVGQNGEPVESVEAAVEIPTAFALEAAYPNPFNPETTIRFSVPESAQVRLVVYDVLGRQVRVLVDGVREAGVHEVVFEATSLPSGTYLYRLETPQGSFVQTMQLVK